MPRDEAREPSKKGRRAIKTQAAMSVIRSKIVNGPMRPGTKITRSDAESFLAGTEPKGTRTPVTAAFWALALEGLVEMRDGESVVVREAGDDTTGSLLATSLVLETFVAWELASGEERSLDRLDELQERMRGLVDAPEEAVPEFIDLDAEFHCAIAELAGYYEAAFFIRRLRNITRLRIINKRSKEDRRQATVDEHERILDAIKARDLEAVEIAVRNHAVQRAHRWFPDDDIDHVQSLDIFDRSRGKGGE